MLAVRAAESELAPLLGAGLDLAAVNAPNRTVVAGAERGDRALSKQRLNDAGIAVAPAADLARLPLADDGAGRSRRSRARIAAASLRAPSTAVRLERDGHLDHGAEATSPQYWARHCREPVRFADALQTLVDAGVDTLLEVGPAATLARSLCKVLRKARAQRVIRSLPGSERERPISRSCSKRSGGSGPPGHKPTWSALHPDAVRTRVSLPTYPFERTALLDRATGAGARRGRRF